LAVPSVVYQRAETPSPDGDPSETVKRASRWPESRSTTVRSDTEIVGSASTGLRKALRAVFQWVAR
jgi:hypothetical protein